jgi:3',5'-cyclic AMP phosphodiesterase CpdA
VGREQLRWLTRTLAEAKAAGEKAIVFCHFPVYPPGEHNLWNDTEVIETLEASGSVVAYISGHDHAGGHAAKDGIHYLTVRGMVETGDSNAYAVVHVESDRLEIDGRGRQPDQVLVFGAADEP